MTASLTKFRINFEKESTVSRGCQNSKSWVTKQNLKKKKIYWCKEKSNQPCLPQGARQQQFACPSKYFFPDSSVLHEGIGFAWWHNSAGTYFCNHIPTQGEGLTCIQWALCLFWAVKREKFLSRILQIGATGGRSGPVSIKRTWEKAESWAHIRREAESRRRG